MNREHQSRSATRNTLALEALQQSGSLQLQVSGESMLPTLWPGDLVEIKRCSLHDVAAGEIVLAIRDNRFYMHRLSRVSLDSFITCGDSMPKTDPPFSSSAFIGKVVAIKRGQCVQTPPHPTAWNRFVGLILCYCGPARRIILRLRKQSIALEEFPPSTTAHISGAS